MFSVMYSLKTNMRHIPLVFIMETDCVLSDVQSEDTHLMI